MSILSRTGNLCCFKLFRTHVIYDPWADADHVKHEYGVAVTNRKTVLDNKYDAIILAVAHEEFVNIDVRKMLTENGVVYDVKGLLPREVIDGRL